VRSRLAALRAEHAAREPLRLEAVACALGLAPEGGRTFAVSAPAVAPESPAPVPDVPPVRLTEEQ
jgi:hypothetical protein